MQLMQQVCDIFQIIYEKFKNQPFLIVSTDN